MKLLIVGSRSITDFDLSPYVPADVDTVISGGAGASATRCPCYTSSSNRVSMILAQHGGEYLH